MVYKLIVLIVSLFLTACGAHTQRPVAFTTTDQYGIKRHYAKYIDKDGKEVTYECFSCVPTINIYKSYPIRSTLPHRTIVIIRR